MWSIVSKLTISVCYVIPAVADEYDEGVECLSRISTLNAKFSKACKQISGHLQKHSNTNDALNNFCGKLSWTWGWVNFDVYPRHTVFLVASAIFGL